MLDTVGGIGLEDGAVSGDDVGFLRLPVGSWMVGTEVEMAGAGLFVILNDAVGLELAIVGALGVRLDGKDPKELAPSAKRLQYHDSWS